MRWARARVATAWLAAWPYLALGVLAAPLAWMRRRHAGAQVALILLASAWLYLLPLCLLAASAEVRYVAWSCVASLLAFAGTAFALLDSDETPRRDANEHRAALHVQHR